MVWNWGNFLQEDTKPRIVDTRTGEIVCVLEGHADYVRGCRLLDDDSLLTWSNDETLRLWRLDGSCIAVLEGHSGYISSVLELDGNRIASSSGDGAVRIWSRADGECLRCLTWDHHAANDTPTLHCAQGDRLVVGFEQRILLVDTVSDETLSETRTGQYFPHALAYDDAHFMIVADDCIELFRWRDGESVSLLQVKDYSPQILCGPEDQLLTASVDRKTRSRLTFRLWRPLSGDLLASAEMSGAEALSMAFDENGGRVEVWTKDYRRLTLALPSLQVVKKNGVESMKAEGFDVFAPDRGRIDAEKGRELDTSWLDRRSAHTVDFTGLEERPDFWKSGALADGRLVLRFPDQWRVYENSMKEYEAYSDAHMRLAQPDYLQSLQHHLCLNGDAHALAIYAAAARGRSPEAVSRAIARLHEDDLLKANERAHLLLAPAREGSVIGFASMIGAVWRLREEGDAFELICHEDAQAFVQGEPVIAPDGVLHRWTQEGARPLTAPGDGPVVAVHPEFRSRVRNSRWRGDSDLLVRSGTGVSVFDVPTGRRKTFLDGGHGMGNWGFRELAAGPIVTWSRLSLRSWHPDTYAPLMELQDPEDWGPGYEVVRAVGERLVFSPGQHTHDTRVMLWDGRYKLSVYGGHNIEIADIRMLKPGVFLSEGADAWCGGELHLWMAP